MTLAAPVHKLMLIQVLSSGEYMPIPSTCPECLAAFNIPDKFAGKTVKCRECEGHIQVPGGEIEELDREEEVQEDRPRKKRNRNDEDDNDRPRKRRKTKLKKPSPGLVVGIVVGAVLVIGLVVTTVLLLSSDKNRKSNDSVANSGTPTKRPELPAGWVDFKHPKGLYSVYLPSTPILAHSSNNRPPQNFNFGGGLALEESYAASSLNKESPVMCGIDIVPNPPGGLDGFAAGQANPGANLFPGVKWSNTRMTWAGKPAVEMVVEMDLSGAMAAFPGMNKLPNAKPPGGAANPPIAAKSKSHIRYVIVNDKLYMFELSSLGGSPSETYRAAFYDSVVFGN